MTSGNKVDPLTLMGSLMGAMMGGGGGGGQMASSNPLHQLAGLAMASAINTGGVGPIRGGRGGYDRDRRERQRDRGRSPPRRNFRSRSRSRDRRHQRRSSGNSSRRARSPEKRAEHEIYIGNYPVKFREADVRKLFEDHQVKVGAIRLKHDGLKVFAFAETESSEEIEKAKSTMEGVEIQGRKLRVRSSKDTDKKKSNEEKEKERREERRKRQEREALKKEDVTKHLVTAFVAFLGREFESEAVAEDDRFKDLIDTAKTALITAYSLPEDDSLDIPRKIEDIFFRDVRHDVKIEKLEMNVEIKEEPNADDDNDEKVGDDEDDDNGNWKRKVNRSNEEEDEDEEGNNAANDTNENLDTTDDNIKISKVENAASAIDIMENMAEKYNEMIENEIVNNEEDLLVQLS